MTTTTRSRMPARCGRPSPRLAVLAAGVLVVTGAYAYAVPGTAGAAPTSAAAVTTVRLPVDVARRLSARHSPSRVVPARGASLLTGQTDDTVAGAWNYTKGLDRTGRPVVVAVVDSGVDMTDPGLRDAMWTNPGEMPRNAIDDDHNGFVDDVHGADLITPGDDTHDPYRHGTEVAGVIAARPDGTDDGVTGIAYQAQIMSVRVLDETGRGNSAQLAAGIDYAVANGADVINVSVNTQADGDDLAAALQFAADRGVAVVAAAGNDGRDLDVNPSFPAADASEAIVSTAALDTTSHLAWFSNYGVRTVDVTAPGLGLLTLSPDDGESMFSGTSAAAAYASGVVALMRAASDNASPGQIRGTMMSTAHDLGAMPVGSGSVTVDQAVGAMTSLPRATPAVAVRMTRVSSTPSRRVQFRLVVSGTSATPGRCVIAFKYGSKTQRLSVDMRNSVGTVRTSLPRTTRKVSASVNCADAGGQQLTRSRVVLRPVA